MRVLLEKLILTNRVIDLVYMRQYLKLCFCQRECHVMFVNAKVLVGLRGRTG